MISRRKTIKRQEVEKQDHEEEENSKEVQDLDKTSPTREQAYNDEKSKSSLFDPFGNNQMKQSALRIKPLVMKRCWSSMSMKNVANRRRKNSDKVQHVENLDETFVSVLLLDEGEVVQLCFPLAHEDEGVISPNDTDDFGEDLSNMVD
jgi:hypothetical protein